MTLSRPSESRQLPVRLDRIREDVRLRAARQVARQVPADGAECLFAALYPSQTVYWVGLDAAPIWARVAA